MLTRRKVRELHPVSRHDGFLFQIIRSVKLPERRGGQLVLARGNPLQAHRTQQESVSGRRWLSFCLCTDSAPAVAHCRERIRSHLPSSSLLNPALLSLPACRTKNAGVYKPNPPPALKRRLKLSPMCLWLHRYVIRLL